MIEDNLKNIVESLIDTFLKAGEVSLDLRKKGLTKEIKSDNTYRNDVLPHNNQVKSTKSDILVLDQMIE